MFRPDVAAWVKEPYYLPRIGIDARDVGAFVSIAADASKSEIVQFGLPAMLSGENVVDLKRRQVVRGGQVAIFTPMTSSGPDLTSKIGSQSELL